MEREWSAECFMVSQRRCYHPEPLQLDVYGFFMIWGGFLKWMAMTYCLVVVYPPLWKIWVRQLGWLATQYFWKNKFDGNQTTNQLSIESYGEPLGMPHFKATSNVLVSPRNWGPAGLPRMGPGIMGDYKPTWFEDPGDTYSQSHGCICFKYKFKFYLFF